VAYNDSRPDVSRVNKDGTIDRTEARSKGQTTQELVDKQATSRPQMGIRAGIDRVVESDPVPPPRTTPPGRAAAVPLSYHPVAIAFSHFSTHRRHT
jgi:hypothetical protein